MKNEVELRDGKYYFKGKSFPRVSDILEAVGQVEGLRFFTEESARRGTVVHTITQLYDEDDLVLDSVDPQLAGYFAAYKEWREDYIDRIVVKAIEKPVVNLKYKYAGTPDREMLIDGDFALLSIKSGQFARWHILQEMAYRMCYPKPPPSYGLYLKDNGRYKFGKVDEPGATQAWMACVVLFYWRMG